MATPTAAEQNVKPEKKTLSENSDIFSDMTDDEFATSVFQEKNVFMVSIYITLNRNGSERLVP